MVTLHSAKASPLSRLPSPIAASRRLARTVRDLHAPTLRAGGHRCPLRAGALALLLVFFYFLEFFGSWFEVRGSRSVDVPASRHQIRRGRLIVCGAGGEWETAAGNLADASCLQGRRRGHAAGPRVLGPRHVLVHGTDKYRCRWASGQWSGGAVVRRPPVGTRQEFCSCGPAA